MRGRNHLQGLFVGENPTTPALMRIYLDETPFAALHLTQARTLDEALPTIATSPPDLILLNDRLPPSKSYRAPLAQILAAGPTRPVVLLADDVPTDFGTQGVDRRVRAVWRKAEFSPAYLNARLTEVFGTQLAAA